MLLSLHSLKIQLKTNCLLWDWEPSSEPWARLWYCYNIWLNIWLFWINGASLKKYWDKSEFWGVWQVKCIFYFTTSICSITISWKHSLSFWNAEGQMKSCCYIFLDKCYKIIKQSYKSIFVFLSRKEKKWGFYNGKERLTGICIYRVCSTSASNKPLIPSHSLFLFAYDGKISSCPSNPKHLSQPMKESICF